MATAVESGPLSLDQLALRHRATVISPLVVGIRRLHAALLQNRQSRSSS